MTAPNASWSVHWKMNPRAAASARKSPSGDAAPMEAAPTDAAPMEVAPMEVAPREAAPMEAAPGDAAAMEAAAESPGDVAAELPMVMIRNPCWSEPAR